MRLGTRARSLEEFIRVLRERGIKQVQILTKRTYNPRGTREFIRLIAVADGFEYVGVKIEASVIRADFVSKMIEEELRRTRESLLDRLVEEGFEVEEVVEPCKC